MAKSSSALPILAGGAALILLSGGKKKRKKSGGGSSGGVRWGIRVSGDCKTVDVVDAKLFNQFMYGAFHELVEADPTLTLIQMTDALFGDIAPQCSGFPEEPESDQVAELYAVIARNIGHFMVEDPRVDLTVGGLIDEATRITFLDWYRAWRNYPSSEVPIAPQDQVSFSSDLSTYEIGPDWYEKTVLPFVGQAGVEGRLETAFQDFVANRGVKVGQFVMSIAELPQGGEAVEHFLDQLEEAIEKASAAVSGGVGG